MISREKSVERYKRGEINDKNSKINFKSEKYEPILQLEVLLEPIGQ